jgi:hypothetical protein
MSKSADAIFILSVFLVLVSLICWTLIADKREGRKFDADYCKAQLEECARRCK